MDAEKYYLAIDLGASSGRAILGIYNGGTLKLQEVHRFENGPTEMQDGLHWDTDHIMSEIKRGIRVAFDRSRGRLQSMGVDTWGVDYGLLDAAGRLVHPPFNYRDSRTDGVPEKVYDILPQDRIFARTGLQFMQINTLYQLMADAWSDDSPLDRADCMLMMADLFNYMLTGRKVSEKTLASTSQCFNPRTGEWAFDILEELGLPKRIFPEIIEAGNRIGPLLPPLVDETGAEGVSVVAVGAHDTASAVAATPAKGSGFAYVSLGTWALIGTETTSPVIDDKCMRLAFTNEGGVMGTNRLLKNATGLWIVQECQRNWSESGADISFAELAELASAAEPFQAFIDTDANDFAAPCDMPAIIRSYCESTGQKIPQDKGSIVRIVLESLALKINSVLKDLEELSGAPIGALHVVGGGTQNTLLCQFIANAIGRVVFSGPVEATAIGNIVMQMVALEDIDTVEDGRALVRRSFPIESYTPENSDVWQSAGARFSDMLYL